MFNSYYTQQNISWPGNIASRGLNSRSKLFVRKVGKTLHTNRLNRFPRQFFAVPSLEIPVELPSQFLVRWREDLMS